MSPTRLTLILACTAALASCRASPLSTYRVTDGVDAIENVGGGKVRGIEVVDERHERRDGRLYVQVQLRNSRGSRAQIETQHEWFDEAGFRVGEASNWMPVELGPGEVDTFNFTGPTPAAATFDLRLRDRESVR